MSRVWQHDPWLRDNDVRPAGMDSEDDCNSEWSPVCQLTGWCSAAARYIQWISDCWETSKVCFLMLANLVIASVCRMLPWHGLSISLSVTLTLHCARVVWWNEMPFSRDAHVDPSNIVTDSGKGNLGVGTVCPTLWLLFFLFRHLGHITAFSAD